MIISINGQRYKRIEAVDSDDHCKGCPFDIGTESELDEEQMINACQNLVVDAMGGELCDQDDVQYTWRAVK